MNNRFNTLLLFCFLFSACKKNDPAPAPDSRKEITAFALIKTLDPVLPQDIRAVLDGDTIRLIFLSGTDRSALKAVFNTSGVQVTVNGVAQQSGISVLDFRQPQTYTVKAADGSEHRYWVKCTDTELPVLYVSTNNVPVDSKEVYVNGSMQIKIHLDGDSLYEGPLEIRGRGNSTWGMPKKPYKIKLAKKSGLLGMADSKQWVLLANYADKSLLRNDLAFEISRRLQLAYTPDCRFVDLVLNGAYQGTYQLTEQIDVDPKKLNIAKQAAGAGSLPEISGGYLLEADGFAYTEPAYFNTPNGMAITIHYPDDKDLSVEQTDYISHHLASFEERLFATDFTDPITGYQSYFDLASYINWYLVNEIMANPDSFWSTYFFKNRGDDRLYAGPVWDLDIAANNDERIRDAVHQLMIDVAHEPKTWINRLFKDPAFRHGVRARWNSIKASLIQELPLYIEQRAKALRYSQVKNFQAWDILQQKVYLNLQVAGSYNGEVVYLKNFITDRLNWLDGVFNGSRFD